MSVDQYRAGLYQGYWYQDASYARLSRPRATVTKGCAYNIARGIRGPSAMGPYTRYNTFGVCWGATICQVSGPGGAGESFGP